MFAIHGQFTQQMRNRLKTTGMGLGLVLVEDTLHARLLDLLTRYNVNDYAASVRVFAVKP